MQCTIAFAPVIISNLEIIYAYFGKNTIYGQKKGRETIHDRVKGGNTKINCAVRYVRVFQIIVNKKIRFLFFPKIADIFARYHLVNGHVRARQIMISHHHVWQGVCLSHQQLKGDVHNRAGQVVADVAIACGYLSQQPNRGL